MSEMWVQSWLRNGPSETVRASWIVSSALRRSVRDLASRRNVEFTTKQLPGTDGTLLSILDLLIS